MILKNFSEDGKTLTGLDADAFAGAGNRYRWKPTKNAIKHFLISHEWTSRVRESLFGRVTGGDATVIEERNPLDVEAPGAVFDAIRKKRGDMREEGRKVADIEEMVT